MVEIVELETPHGTARAHRLAPEGTSRGTLVLGHGAGGSITAPDLQTAAAAAVALGVEAILVEQPYRVAGRKAAAPAKQLDTAWISVIQQLGLAPQLSHDSTQPPAHAVAPTAVSNSPQAHAVDATPPTNAATFEPAAGTPLFVGGRSSGARVACRTAQATGATGVLCLAFPLITPKQVSRQDELDGAGVPVLVVQGRTDRFGMPEPDAALNRTVVQVDGDHGLKRDQPLIASAVGAWLTTHLA